MNLGDTVYRYERDHFYPEASKAILREFKIVKLTNGGCWIEVYRKKKFILHGAKSKFAYPTKEAAWAHFGQRTKKHIQILESNLKYARLTLIATTKTPTE